MMIKLFKKALKLVDELINMNIEINTIPLFTVRHELEMKIVNYDPKKKQKEDMNKYIKTLKKVSD